VFNLSQQAQAGVLERRKLRKEGKAAGERLVCVVACRPDEVRLACFSITSRWGWWRKIVIVGGYVGTDSALTGAKGGPLPISWAP
jgi:hypothetical protein